MMTIKLDDNWDWTLDSSGNIALAADPASQAQDAASQMRLFQGELNYDTTQGIPYFSKVLGHLPPAPLLGAYLEAASLLVPGIATATAIFNIFQNRNVAGQVQLMNTTGQIATADFNQ